MRYLPCICYLTALIQLLLYAYPSFSEEKFASIKSNKANARKGPSMKSPIVWTYINKNEPVKIITEFGQWRCIEDYHGDKSWIHVSILSSRRFVIFLKRGLLRRDHDSSSPVIAVIEQDARCGLEKQTETSIKIRCHHGNKEISGWSMNKNIWGV